MLLLGGILLIELNQVIQVVLCLYSDFLGFIMHIAIATSLVYVHCLFSSFQRTLSEEP